MSLTYSCKCGESKSYGSMPPRLCDGCDVCGTNLALLPMTLLPKLGHEFEDVPVMTKNPTQQYASRCKHCRLTVDEIEKLKTLD